MINTTICEIDVKTRSVYVPPNLKTIGVQSDDEVVYRDFKVAKTTPEGIDLSDYSLKVNYLDASGNGYVSPIITTTVSGDYISFRWLISRNATQFKGNIKAVCCFRIVNATTQKVTSEWNSGVCEFEVLEGVPVNTDWQPTQEITDAVATVIAACKQAAADAKAGLEKFKKENAYTPQILSGQTPAAYAEHINIVTNVFKTIKLATYNLAELRLVQANNQGSTAIAYLPDKIFNFRKFLMREKLDFLIMQEFSYYLGTSDSTFNTNNSLLKPFFAMTNPSSILRRISSVHQMLSSNDYAVSSDETSVFSGASRNYCAMRYAIGTKTLLIINVHNFNSYITNSDPGNIDGPVACRKKYLEEMSLTLSDLKSTYRPDFIIIAGDFNTSNIDGITSNGDKIDAGTTDFDNLNDFCAQNNLKKVNGDLLGWFYTFSPDSSDAMAVDNILVSKNIEIADIRCSENDFDNLYSDHAPLVATLKLLETSLYEE